MSIHFGLSTSNRQSSLEFSAKGLNVRKVQDFASMEMRVGRPLVPFNVIAFYSSIPHVMASAHLQHPTVIGAPLIGFSLNLLANYKDGSSVISFATPAPLDDVLIRKHSLIFKNPGGRYSSGYYTQNPIDFSNLSDFAADFPSTLVHRDSGVAGIGLSLKAASGLITLGRLVAWYLSTQRTQDYTPQDLTSVNNRGYAEYVLAEAMDENAVVTLSREDDLGIATIGSAWSSKLGLVDDVEYGLVQQTTNPISSFWVQPDRLPPGNGHAFEFVESSLPADRRMVRDVLAEYFSHAFSSSQDRSFSAISVIVDNLVPISRHPHGQELLHILATIRFGIQAYSQVVVVVDHRHKLLGTILLTDSHMSIEQRVLVPLVSL